MVRVAKLTAELDEVAVTNFNAPRMYRNVFEMVDGSLWYGYDEGEAWALGLSAGLDAAFDKFNGVDQLVMAWPPDDDPAMGGC